MLPNPFDSGKLEKMIIQAYKPQVGANDKPELSDAEEDKYMAQVNPEHYTINYQINYDNRAAHGNSGSEKKFSNTSPPELEFEFLFDGTGVIPAAAGPLDNVPIAGAVAGAISSLLGDDDAYDVTIQLQKFAKVVYHYDGDQHRPRKVRLSWGTLAFDAVLTNLSVEYKLFKPNGNPLRAVAKATFSNSVPDVYREHKERNNSPDLTHMRKVTAGDKLPLMTHQIYRTPDYYMEVARANKLINFRNLKAGTTVSFPPVDK